MEFQPTCCQTSEDPVDGGDGAGGAISDSSPKKRPRDAGARGQEDVQHRDDDTTEMKCGM